MFYHTLPNSQCKIYSRKIITFIFNILNHTNGLKIMLKAELRAIEYPLESLVHQLTQFPLTDMSKGGMPQVMS